MKGSAFTFVSGDEGDLLTNIEMRVNLVIEPYAVHGVEAHRGRPKRQHVSELPPAETKIEPVNDDDFWSVG